MADTAGFQFSQHRAAVPCHAVAIIIGVTKQSMVFEIYRRPQPVKLRHHFGNAALRVMLTDRPDSPASVARTVPAGHLMRGALETDHALPAHILRCPCVIHKQARPVMAREARLFYGRMACRGFETSGHSVFRIINAHAHAEERLDNLDAYRPNDQIQSIAQHVFGCTHIMLAATNGQTETRIHNIQLRIDTQRSSKKYRPVGGVSVEKEPVVKIPLAGSQGHWLRCLMKRIIIRGRQHKCLTLQRCRHRF